MPSGFSAPVPPGRILVHAMENLKRIDDVFFSLRVFDNSDTRFAMMQVVEMGRAGRMALVRDLGGQGQQAVADVQKKGEDGKNSQWLMTECPNNN